VSPGGRPTLTVRGRGVLVAAAILLAAAKLFGSGELAGLAAAAGAAVVLATVLVRRAPLSYRAERWLAPSRVGVGDAAHARLRFTNTGTSATVAAEALDGPNQCLIPPLAPGAMAEARTELPTGRRGTFTVGPLAISVSDPLGLVERRVEAAGTDRLVVHPRIRAVLALPGSPTREARQGSTVPARAARGDDFFALREYEVGDDLRRVHWRSTARLGDLMLRQDELRFGEVATVLLDTRAAAHRGDSFERALEVAGSVAAALVEDGRRLRFVTTGGFDVELDGARAATSGGRAEGRWAAVLEHLALATPDDARKAEGVSPAMAAGAKADPFALAVQSIRRSPSGPLAAVMGPEAGPSELAALGALRSRLGLVMIVSCTSGPAAELGAPSAPGAVIVPLGAAQEFPSLWNAAVLSCGRREVARR
jgi:uncharacterized protein (DUF58 family)